MENHTVIAPGPPVYFKEPGKMRQAIRGNSKPFAFRVCALFGELPIVTIMINILVF